MDAGFWREKWRKGETGFHQAEGNRFLRQYWDELDVPSGAPVLVPLCGKTPDMLWLRDRGHPVVGVELSELAAEAFFADNGLHPERTAWRGGWRYRGEGIEILQGDFFDAQRSDLPAIQAVYDRAALIALPVPLRARYVEHLQALLPNLSAVLLVALDYEPGPGQNPPFSVPEDEITRLYGARFTVHRLAREDVLAQDERLRQRGLTALHETAYCLRKEKSGGR